MSSSVKEVIVLSRYMRRAVFFLVVIFTTLLLPFNVFAGSGDGTGGGKDQPLLLISSDPADGQTGVPSTAHIKLSFNKNVVNMTIADSNKECFTLVSAAGEMVPVEVVMADDQIEPEKRRDIILEPSRQLLPGTEYTLKVAPELSSKSGVTLGEQVNITFTTLGMAANKVISPVVKQTPPASTQATAATGTGDSQSVKTANSQSVKTANSRSVETANNQAEAAANNQAEETVNSQARPNESFNKTEVPEKKTVTSTGESEGNKGGNKANNKGGKKEENRLMTWNVLLIVCAGIFVGAAVYNRMKNK